jgi:polyhydroxyalkanoate synthesis regulator phasin
MDDTYDLLDDTLDRVRDDDYDDLEDEVEELKEAVAAINAKIDRLLAQGSLDVREGSTTKPAMKTPV